MQSMKKQLLLESTAFILSCAFCFLTACGSDAASSADADPETRGTMIEEVENLPDATIKIPAPLVGDELTDALGDPDDQAVPDDQAASDPGEPSDENSRYGQPDEDNNFTLDLTGEARTQILHDLAAEIQDSIDTVLADKYYYPNISDILVNGDCTEFTICLTTDAPNIYESMLMLSFYTVGDRYQIYNGVPMEDARTTVIYINVNTGAELARTDSTSVE